MKQIAATVPLGVLNTLVPDQLPLAGFVLTPVGRFSTDPRGYRKGGRTQSLIYGPYRVLSTDSRRDGRYARTAERQRGASARFPAGLCIGCEAILRHGSLICWRTGASRSAGKS